MGMTERSIPEDYQQSEISEDEARAIMDSMERTNEAKAFHIMRLLDADTETADAVVSVIEDEDGRRVLRALAGWLVKLDRIAALDAELDTFHDAGDLHYLLSGRGVPNPSPIFILHNFYESRVRKAVAEKGVPI